VRPLAALPPEYLEDLKNVLDSLGSFER
jgi:hypothetical protein